MGFENAIAVAADGTVHIAGEYDFWVEQEGLLYATGTAGAWHVEQLDAEGGPASGSAIAVDADGSAHIAYGDYMGDPLHLRYATNRGGSWDTETLLTEEGVGGYPSIAADADGQPHISYANLDDDTLEYATRADGDWVHYTVADLTSDCVGEPAVDWREHGRSEIAVHGDVVSILFYSRGELCLARLPLGWEG